MKSHKIVFLWSVLAVGMMLLPAWALAATKREDPKRPWTILIYGAVDNSADDPFVDFTDRVRRAIDDDPGIDLLLFIDRARKHKNRVTFLGEDFTSTRLYRVKKNSVERLSGGTYFPEITRDSDVNLNSADASTLQRFIAWGKANSPAHHYGLLIYSHADGKSMCPDERTDSVMGIAEPTEKIGPQERVDFLALELCNMGGIEIGYQWRPGNGRFEADVLVAIPNAGPPLDWDRAFARMRSPGHAGSGGSVVDPTRMTAVDFGKLVIEEGHRGRQASEKSGEPASKESAACYDLRKAGEVKRTVDALAVALAKSKSREALLEIRNANSEQLISYSQDQSYVDLYDLCRRVAASERFAETVRAAAREVMKSVQGLIISSFGMSGYRQFDEGKNGVFIVLPSGRPNSWRHYRWYTPIRGSRNSYGNWSFLKDGATPGNGIVENWYELLESWFNVPAEPVAIAAAEGNNELDRLQGEWTWISRESAGQKTGPEILKRYKLSIKGDQWIVTSSQTPNFLLKMTISIDPTKDPKTLDLTPTDGKDPDVSLGIYKLEGDTITLCRNGVPGDFARPREFKAESEEVILVVWKRAVK